MDDEPELLKGMKLKQSVQTQDIPVLMLSALDKDTDCQVGLNCGADAYLAKPYDNKVLLDKISE